MEGKKKGSGGLIIIIIIILVVAWFVFGNKDANAPAMEEVGEVMEGEDTTAAIDAELNTVDVGDVDGAMMEVDAEMEAL
jgi:hypothetical protein